LANLAADFDQNVGEINDEFFAERRAPAAFRLAKEVR
jgi:hypothetical protein